MKKMSKEKSVRDRWRLACPKCNRDDKINVWARMTVRLTPDGIDMNEAKSHSPEWDGDCSVSCSSCGVKSQARAFYCEPGENKMHPISLWKEKINKNEIRIGYDEWLAKQIKLEKQRK